MAQGLEDHLLKYDRLDFDKFCEKQEATQGVASEQKVAPVASSWLTLYVQIPSRLAATTILCIFLYEVLVAISMGVRTLRWVMVNWLMYLFLAINGILLIALGILVLRAKKDVSLRYFNKMIDDSRATTQKREMAYSEDVEL